MDSWNDIRHWRIEQRAKLIAERAALTAEQKSAATAAIVESLVAALSARLPINIEERGDEGPAASDLGTGGACVAFYWPMRGELDLRPFVRALVRLGVTAALPVIVARNSPLEFWRWESGTRMTRQEVWGIPVPAQRVAMLPQTLLIPLIGFDGRCHRLGHGGGYYDRTLAALRPAPYKIGVGFDHGEVASIFPQRHDVPMDLIVTEARTLSRA